MRTIIWLQTNAYTMPEILVRLDNCNKITGNEQIKIDNQLYTEIFQFVEISGENAVSNVVVRKHNDPSYTIGNPIQQRINYMTDLKSLPLNPVMEKTESEK